MTKYRATSWSIETVEVERETDKFVVRPNGRRDAKSSDWSSYFDTEGDAWAWSVQQRRLDVENEQRGLDEAVERLHERLEEAKRAGFPQE
jgi:hypothetical protein